MTGTEVAAADTGLETVGWLGDAPSGCVRLMWPADCSYRALA